MTAPWERQYDKSGAKAPMPWQRKYDTGPQHTDMLYNHETGEFMDPKDVSGANADASRLGSATMGLIEGIPVVGAPLQEASEAYVAGLASVLSGEPYGEMRQRVDRGVDASFEKHPNYRTAGNITGAVAGTAPMVAVAPGAFGVGAGNIALRSGASAFSGGVLGGADAAVRSGGDPDATYSGALWGGGLGGLGPAAGQVIGAAGRGIRDLGIRAQGLFSFLPERAAPVVKNKQARASLVEALKRDGMRPSDVPKQLAQSGDQAMVMDLGPNLQRRAGKLASVPGKAQTTVRDAVKARDAGANQRIISTIDDTLGRAKTPMQVEDEIKAAKDRLGPQYDELFATKSSRVDTSNIANYLDSEIVRLRGPAQSALKDVRRMLNVSGSDLLDPNPGTLHQTRMAIDGIVADTQNPKIAGALSAVRKQIDAKLADAVPGIKQLDAEWSQAARQGEAFETGRKVLDSGRTAQPPADLARALIQSTKVPETVMGPSGVPISLREGTRAEIDRIIGTSVSDRAALQRLVKGEGSWNRQKLTMLYGQKRANRVMDLVDQERAFADTSQIVTRNSETAARLADDIPSQAARSKTDVQTEFILGGPRAVARGTAVRGAQGVTGKVRNVLGEAGDQELAEMLTASQRSEVLKKIAALEQAGKPVTQRQIDTVVRSVLQAPAVVTGVQ